VKSSGKTFQEELDSEELDLNTPSRRETGARIYKELSAMGEKLRVALTAEAKGRANAAIAEMRRNKDLPRTLASVDGSIREGVIVNKENGTALLNNSARVEVTTIPPIVTFFDDPIPCNMDICGDTGDEEDLFGDNQVQVSLPPAKETGIKDDAPTATYVTLVETEEITIEVDEEETDAERKIGIIANALEEAGRQAGRVELPAVQLVSEEGGGPVPMRRLLSTLN